MKRSIIAEYGLQSDAEYEEQARKADNGISARASDHERRDSSADRGTVVFKQHDPQETLARTVEPVAADEPVTLAGLADSLLKAWHALGEDNDDIEKICAAIRKMRKEIATLKGETSTLRSILRARSRASASKARRRMSHEQEVSRQAHQVIERTLAGLPIQYKLSHLIVALLQDKAALSVEFLLEIAMIMARRLPVHQQTRIVWLLEEARSELKTRWQ